MNAMKAMPVAGLLMLSSLLLGQSAGDSWKAVSFLEGTWEARTQGGSAGAEGSGSYTFQPELDRHILARHSQTAAGCKGPATFDCEHGDRLYIYQDAAGQPLKAIYFDNEGHVIHYDVSAPGPGTALFLSDASMPGPQFRLVYERKGVEMSGKFEMRMPGQKDWTTYLAWAGRRK
jgi:hypothetical protein